MTNLEILIFKNLLHDQKYMQQVLPYIQKEYFSEQSTKKLFTFIKGFIDRYHVQPNIDVLEVILEESKLEENIYKECVEYIELVRTPDESEREWILDETEKFCKDRAIYLAIMESISILDGDNKKLSKDAIPSLLQDAISVSFDPSVGHDYYDDVESRYDFYHLAENRLSFDIDYLNRITKGGLTKKTFTVLLAPTGVGKSLAMCHMAASYMSRGYNVLYITLEMSEERIAERIDANLLDVEVDDLKNINKDSFTQRVHSLKKKSSGKLIVKEYPTSTANSNHFRTLLNELKTKKSFKPDVVFIDYINLATSSRYNAGSVNSYTYIKGIAEELRGLAVVHDVVMVSATQVTRNGIDNSDISLTDTSESIGLPSTCDYMLALIQTEEMKQMKQMMVKQLKNRYGDITTISKFMVGVDKAKMKLYNLNESAQDSLTEHKVKQISQEPNFINNTNNAKQKLNFNKIQL